MKKERANYAKIFENGENHLYAALLLEREGLYGFAVSHIVLGLEELIKYVVVRFHLMDDDRELFSPEVSESGKSSVFRSHVKKHSLVAEFQEAVSEESVRQYEQMFKRIFGLNKDDDTHSQNDANRFRGIGALLHAAFEEINISDADKKDFLEWLRMADQLKKLGLYVDRIGDELVSPNTISKEDFLRSYNYAKALLEQTRILTRLDTND